LIRKERTIGQAIHPLAIGIPLIGATMNMPTSAAMIPMTSPQSQSGAVNRGRSRPNTAPYRPPQKHRSTINGTLNGGIGLVGYGGLGIWPTAYSRAHTP